MDQKRKDLFDSILKCINQDDKKEKIEQWKQLIKEEMKIAQNHLSGNGLHDNLWKIITEYLVQFPIYESGKFRKLPNPEIDICNNCRQVTAISNAVSVEFYNYLLGESIYYTYICGNCIHPKSMDMNRFHPYCPRTYPDELRKKCLELCVIDFDIVELCW